LGELPVGTFRPLSHEELQKLRDAATGMRRGKPMRGSRGSGKRTGAKAVRGGKAATPRKRQEKVEFRTTGAIIGGDDSPRPRPTKGGRRS
jgi:hypothetical protein